MMGRGMQGYALRLLKGDFPISGALAAAARTFLVLLVLAGAICGTGYAEADGYPTHPVNLSLFYPISTNRDPEVSTYLRLNLIYSDIGAVRGVDLNGIGGRIRRDMVGFQASGIYSHILGELRGVSVSGAANFVQSDAAGFQYAGMVNFVRGGFTGLQMANLFNYVEGEMRGAQATGIFNLNNGNVRYFQLSTIANAVAGDVTGVQAAVGLNYVNEDMFGGQLGLCNFAKYVKGVQIGLGNVAGVADGVQLGFINVAKEVNGIPIGMFNFVEDGDVDWVTFASNMAAASTGVRSIYRHFYSVLAIGVGDLKDKRNDTAFLSWHYGYAVPVRGRWKMGVDLGYVHIMPASSADPEVKTENQFAVQARAIAEIEIRKRFNVFGGGGVSQRFSAYSSDNSSTTDPLVVLGVSLY
jgi:hypothetical protein